ncbi:MAG: PAS domain S-box protein, partial [Nitrospinaceae bacterium]
METHKDIDFVLVFGGLFLAADVFALDLMLPMEIMVGVPYAVVVLLGLFWPGRAFVLIAAVLCTALTGLGVYFSPPKQEWMDLALDRGTSLIVIWLVAGLCLSTKRAQRKKEEMRTLIASICRVQSQSLAQTYDPALFKNILNSLLKLTDSEIGVVGEVLKTPSGEAHFQPIVSALANGSFGAEALDLYKRPSTHGVEIYSMDALLDEVVATGRPLYIADARGDGGIPTGHPLLRTFMGLPFYHGGQVLGIVGLANRAGGYPEDFSELLKPFLFTFANIILFMRKEAEPVESKRQVEEYEARLKNAEEREQDAQKVLEELKERQAEAEREKEEMEQAFFKSVEQLKHIDREREEAALALKGSQARLGEVERELAHWEDAMHRGEEDLKRLAQSTGGWFWEMNAEGLYTYASSGVEKMLGYRSEDIAGKKYFYDLFTAEKRESLKMRFFELMERGEPLSRLVSEKRSNIEGRTVFVETIGIPILDASGEVTSYQGIECDVSEREKARRDLENVRLWSQGVLDAADEGFYGIDLEGNVTFINAAALGMLGYLVEEMTGEPQARFLRPGEGEVPGVTGLPGEGAFLEGAKKYESQELFWRKDGTCFQARLISRPVWKEERLAGAVVSFAARDGRVEAVEHAAPGPSRETPALAPADERACPPRGIALGLQDALRKIVAFGGRLQDKYGDMLDDRGRDYLMRMNRSAGRMQEFLDDWSAYSRVGSGGRAMKPVDLSAVVEEVVSLMQPYIDRYGGALRIGPLPTLMADRAEMHQLFQHLITNALKFRRVDVAPEVRIEARPGREGFVEILVIDNGIGIDAAAARFEPLDGVVPARGGKGTGMGLAICAKIVQRHGGKIAAHGVP